MGQTLIRTGHAASGVKSKPANSPVAIVFQRATPAHHEGPEASRGRPSRR